jgi:ferritin-like metal-binding protein YciE
MAETIDSTRGLFVHQLKQLLWTERKLSDEVLPELREHVESDRLKADVAHHLEETRGHVRNLERVFEMLDVKPQAEESEALKGLRREHDGGMKLLSGPGPLADLFHAASIAKSEHAEIAAYEGMIEIAERLREDEIANLLRENLEQEQGALRKAEQGMRKLLEEGIPV